MEQEHNPILDLLLLAGLGLGAYWLYLRSKQTTTKTTNYMNTDTSLPRGYRNNNPLNIRYSSKNDWKGKVLPNTDGTFEQFTSMAYGYRAALKLIRNYINAGYNTVSKVIRRWAPANENNTEKYITDVCYISGNFTPETVLDPNNKEQLMWLVYCMAIVENGTTITPNSKEIEEGWNLL